jgi:capsular polysaccharide biosynthesis protein
MNEQAMDLRRFTKIVWRRKILVGLLAILGLLAGGAYAVLNPGSVSSTALVALQPPAQGTGTAADGGPDPYTETLVVIGTSNEVLLGALPDVRPSTSLSQLRREVQVGSVTPYIISISVNGKVAADVEATANAIAGSYVSYLGSPASPLGRVAVKVLQPATMATGSRLKPILIDALVAALAGAVIGVIVSLAIGRKDRRLWQRDEIADAIGVPILASLPVHHPTDAASWTKLLEDYEPASLHAWHLRNALRQLGMLLGLHLNNGNSRGRLSLSVLSLSSDPGALALGPQLAVFAASLGIPTALVIGPQQDASVTATLRAACAVPPPGSSKRPDQLRVIVSDYGPADRQLDVTLTVVVVVVDGRVPRMPDTMRTTATVLGVSAGAVTADQVARAAMSAAADGRDIAGILVADPENTDHTTGRAPQLARPTQRRLPTRLKGITTEIRG